MRLLNHFMAIVLVLFAVVFGLGFALSNSDLVQVHYYVGTKTMPLSMLVLGALVLGLVVGWLAALPTIIRLKIEKSYYQRHQAP